MEFIPKRREENDPALEPVLEAASAAGADIIAEFGDANNIVVHERELTVKGRLRTFYVREMDYKTLNRIQEKKWRKTPGGGLEFDVTNGDNMVAAMTIHLGIVLPLGDPKDLSKDNWESMWSVSDIAGSPEVRQGKRVLRPGKAGLLDNGQEEARLFLFELQALVWEVNPTINPMILAGAQE